MEDKTFEIFRIVCAVIMWIPLGVFGLFLLIQKRKELKELDDYIADSEKKIITKKF